MRSSSLYGLTRITVFVALSLTAAYRCRAQRVMLPTAAVSTASGTTVSGVTVESVVPNRLVVFYRGGVVPLRVEGLLAGADVKPVAHMALFGASAVRVNGGSEATTQRAMAALLEHPEVQMVLRDRYVKANAIQVLPVRAAAGVPAKTAAAANPDLAVVGSPQQPFTLLTHPPLTAPVQVGDNLTYYQSAQGWATRLAGGYGAGVEGGPATGPWNVTQGKGARIAILDSGVDETHPSIAPNLVLNLSEVDETALPSACDDGSPMDQTGHGTFTASLAAAGMNGGSDLVIGVAPQAEILNIKVVQRMPGDANGDTQAQCEAGSAGGLLSWVLQGIADAVANHASVISLSLGTLVDTSTGDGAGWVSQMDSVTYAAEQAGAVLVAATGNDGLDLSRGTYVELPAQARGVLPVVASTNPACAENLASNAACVPGPVKRTYYSNYGAALNAIAAPGGSYPEGADLGVSGFVRGACSRGIAGTSDGLPANGRSLGCFGLGHVPYVQTMGTSAAAPLVAGAVAMLQAAHPAWTPTQVMSALRSSATMSGTLTEPSLNLPAALALQ